MHIAAEPLLGVEVTLEHVGIGRRDDEQVAVVLEADLGPEVPTGHTMPIVLPHEHSVQLGQVHCASHEHVGAAIESATKAAHWWGRRDWEERAAPFARAADMLEAGPWRDRLVAAAMLELSKTWREADGDAGCETIDLIRANIQNMLAMYAEQPISPPGIRNDVEYRPLEGFVFAVSPFNFVSTANLAIGPPLLGNTVVWKPAENASLGAHLAMQLLREAGLPDGVVNVVYGPGREIGPVALTHGDLAAVNFTGSTATFQTIWRTAGENITRYRNYPRLIGETGGRGLHPCPSVGRPRGARGRVCPGCLRMPGTKVCGTATAYVPRSLWPALKQRLIELTRQVVVGDPTEPDTHIGAVINASQFRKHADALTRARAEELVLVGGNTDDSTGWFVDPTVLEVSDPHSPFMTEELFAPVITAYVYDDFDWADTFQLVDGPTYRRRVRHRRGRARRGRGGIAIHGRQLLHQRQADGCCRGSTTFRRVAGVRHE